MQSLFLYQTVYDPREKKLTSLEDIPAAIIDTIEPDFLGDRNVIESKEGALDLFVNGFLKKGNLERRESYKYVVDMERMMNDYQMNCVNERSFICADRSYFKSGFSINEPRTRRDGLGVEEEKE